jgi:hypothetical protein
MEYPRWSKEMKDIERIYKEWLDNADLYELTVNQNGNILLKFIVGGTDEEEYWLDVECGGIHVFNMAKSWEESFDDGILVCGFKVKKYDSALGVNHILTSAGWSWGEGPMPEQAYQIEVEGGIEMKIICTSLEMRERREVASKPERRMTLDAN